MIDLYQPLSYSGIGKKDNQEDYLFPSYASQNSHVFILCDGMGGHDNGEVASETVAEAMGDFLSGYKNIDKDIFKNALSFAYDKIDLIVTGSSKKPGTTLACCCFNDDSYLVAHIGDSRIYHFRPSLYNPETKRGGILYQSSDHSLVNDLLRSGEITEQEALSFPQKNIITRAIQPHLEKRFDADIFIFDDIKEGDYFFICSDGVLESLSTPQIAEIIADSGLNNLQKLGKIQEACEHASRDNFSFWIIPIAKTDFNPIKNNTSTIKASEERITTREEKKINVKKVFNERKTDKVYPPGKSISWKFWITLLCVLILALFLLSFFFDFRLFNFK